MEGPNHVSPPDLYSGLSEDKKEIRLLELLPGRYDEPVQCTLKHAALLSSPVATYETISYCWGDASLRQSIIVNGVERDIPESSALALRRVRLVDRPRTVWIDAICINQANILERNRQVAMMSILYASGQANLVYLGEDDITEAVRDVRLLLGSPVAHELLQGSRDSRGHINFTDTDSIKTSYNASALIRLFSINWFKRLWVVQEAVLSKRNIAYCGASEIDLLDLTRAGFCLRRNYFFVHPELGHLCLNVTQLNDLIDHVYGLSHDFNSYIGVSYLTSVAQQRLVTEPIDKVYGILGMVTEMNLVPDYRKSVAQVYEEVTRRLLMICRGIDYLQFVRHREEFFDNPDSGLALPSWVLDLNNPYDPQIEPRALAPYFRADNDEIRELSREQGDPGEARGVLKLAGITVDVVKLTQPKPQERLQRLDEMLAETLSGERTEVREEMLALTLCGGSNMRRERVDAADALEQYRTFREHLLQGSAFSDMLEIDALTDQSLAIASKYRAALVQTCHARTFFATSKGYCGLGPKYMAPGDVAVILFGLHWPAILRPAGDKFRFLGIAYVHGIMNGELVTASEAGGKERSQVFEIV